MAKIVASVCTGLRVIVGVVSRVTRKATESGSEEPVRKFPFSSDSAYDSVAYDPE